MGHTKILRHAPKKILREIPRISAAIHAMPAGFLAFYGAGLDGNVIRVFYDSRSETSMPQKKILRSRDRSVFGLFPISPSIPDDCQMSTA
jgi:hypothetical protein